MFPVYWCVLLLTTVVSFKPASINRGRICSFTKRGSIRMDDEIARPNIKEELTTRDEYLDSRFRRLSTSGLHFCIILIWLALY